jgi:hypothetical protein
MPLAATALAVVAGTAAPAVHAESADAPALVNTGYFGGVAISGYDPVAYFTDGRPIKGSAEFS